MKTLLFVLLSVTCMAQQRFENFSTLRAQKGTYASWALVEYGTAVGDRMGGIFFWDSTSTATDDAKRTIGMWTKGRYVKSEPLTMRRGVAVLTFALGQMSYSFPHGLPATPTNVQYSFQLATPLLLGSSWTADAINITVTLSALGTVGQTFKIPFIAYID